MKRIGIVMIAPPTLCAACLLVSPVPSDTKTDVRPPSLFVRARKVLAKLPQPDEGRWKHDYAWVDENRLLIKAEMAFRTDRFYLADTSTGRSVETTGINRLLDQADRVGDLLEWGFSPNRKRVMINFRDEGIFPIYRPGH